MTPDNLLLFIAASAALCFAPGPDNIFVLTQSALYGPRAGVLVTLGLCTGLLVHTAAVALGVAVLVKTSPVAFMALKLAGAAYLLYLAYGAFRASASKLAAHVQGEDTPGARRLYGRGIVMNITNPKVAIFFLAFLPQFADPANGHLTGQLLLLGAVFIVITLITFGIVAYGAGLIGDWLRRSRKAQIIINRLAGFIFVGLALRLVMTER